MQLIGSMKEGTKIFINDELDIHFSLKTSLADRTWFDVKGQVLYLDQRQFNCQEFVIYYFTCLHSILGEIKLPTSFSMRPLSTVYKPCMSCMRSSHGSVQSYRCHHNQNCKVHFKNICEDFIDCPYECECKMFQSPSIAWSKIGAVLHLGKYVPTCI